MSGINMSYFSTDDEYQEAKRIKQGLQAIDQRFEQLADWISLEYCVTVINISRDFLRHANRLRLMVCVDAHADKMKFMKGNLWWGNYDKAKQTGIAEKYIELANKKKPVINLQFHNLFGRMPTSSDLFVAFSCLEESALAEANESIPEKEITDLQKTLADDRIWLISRCFSSTTLFVFTDEQKENFKEEVIYKSAEDAYFRLLKEYDELDYWKRENFAIHVDSKQALDEKYEGNLFYYYK